MATYVTYDAAGNIDRVGDWQFPGSTEVDFEIVSYQGRIYKKGTEPKPTPEEAAAFKLAEIDTQTNAEIVAGFDYTIDDVSYHFSYDEFDQQNFSDSANVANLIKAGVTGLPQNTEWNGYKNWSNGSGELVRLTFTADTFIQLYTTGALAHKSACMIKGGTRKAAVRDALANKLTVDEINAI